MFWNKYPLDRYLGVKFTRYEERWRIGFGLIWREVVFLTPAARR